LRPRAGAHSRENGFRHTIRIDISLRERAMALKSPRFASNVRCQKASENNPSMNWGETSEGVKALQQALIDLGFPLPLSTKKTGKPDGIFGNETFTQLKAFQSKNKLKPDGSAGRFTWAKLDELLPNAGPGPGPSPGPTPPAPPPNPFTHRIRLHLRSIDTPKVDELKQLAVMEETFKTIGIRIDLISGQSIKLSPDEELTLTTVDGDCKWDQVSDEQRLLQSLGDKTGIAPNDITAYFATVLKESNGGTLQGCAGTATSRPAVMIAAAAVDPTTLAHECCHVLLGSTFTPVHEKDSANLMCEAAICTGHPPTFTQAQIDRIKASKFVQPV
jgi:peptidoglycan hydrolase-like protein with peptidoglycan-binding domain